MWPFVRRGQSLRRALQVNASVGQAFVGSPDVCRTESRMLDSEVVVSAVLFTAYVVAKWKAYRSAWREQAGACFRCSVEEPVVRLGGKEFCEPCAETTLRNYRMGFRFFAFLGILMALLMATIPLKSGLSTGLGPLAKDIAVLLAGIVLATVWISRGMKREELQ